MGLSTYAANEILDLILGTGDWTMPTQVYVSLHTASPGLTGANEVGAAWYTTGGRKQPSGTPKWNAATTSGATNNGTISFPAVSGSSVTVTHVGIWDNATVGAGNFLNGIALGSSKLFTAGSVPFIDDDGITVTAGGGLSNYIIPKVIDHLLGTAAFTFDTSVFLALYTTNPTVADSGTEATGGGYARQAIDFNAASGGSASNTDLENFGTASANIGTVSHFGIRDNNTTGNLHVFGPWDASIAVDSGDIYRLPSGSLTITAG